MLCGFIALLNLDMNGCWLLYIVPYHHLVYRAHDLVFAWEFAAKSDVSVIWFSPIESSCDLFDMAS